MKQKKVALLACLVVIIIAAVGWWVAARPEESKTDKNNSSGQQEAPSTGNNSQSAGRQVCPDAWYDNRMPQPADQAGLPSQYFIISGERVELDELDVEWVKANCIVNEPHIVQ